MYVCLCNALKCTQFKAAAKDGAGDVPSAFKACGAKPQCGRCFEEAERVMSTVRTTEGVQTIDAA